MPEPISVCVVLLFLRHSTPLELLHAQITIPLPFHTNILSPTSPAPGIARTAQAFDALGRLGNVPAPVVKGPLTGGIRGGRKFDQQATEDPVPERAPGHGQHGKQGHVDAAGELRRSDADRGRIRRGHHRPGQL